MGLMLSPGEPGVDVVAAQGNVQMRTGFQERRGGCLQRPGVVEPVTCNRNMGFKVLASAFRRGFRCQFRWSSEEQVTALLKGIVVISPMLKDQLIHCGA